MKKFLALMIALAIVFVLFGCGGEAASAPEQNTELMALQDFTVHAAIPSSWTGIGIWCWSDADGRNLFEAWPGQAMKSDGEGWYSYTVPGWVDSVVVNALDGTVQTADLSVAGKEIWLVVNSDLTCDVYYEKPVVTREKIVYAYVPEIWRSVNCRAWAGDAHVFDKYNGAEMAKSGDWYTIVVPDWVEYVEISGDREPYDSGDVAIGSGKDAWVILACGNEVLVRYEQPSADEMSAYTHKWVDPTCKNVKYCSNCIITDGDFGDHTWENTGCMSTCIHCGTVDQDTVSHTLQEGSDGITGTCTVCNKRIEYFVVDASVYAMTEYNGTTDVVTYIRSRTNGGYTTICWFKDGELVSYEAEAINKDISCKAFYAQGKVYYFDYYADADESTVEKLANAASAYIAWTSCVYGESNCVYGNLVGPGGWIEDDRGHVYAALDAYGNQFCIAHKSSGSWDIPDDPVQTWAIPCNWKK